MHAYIELGFYPGGFIGEKFYFLLQSYVFMILVFHWKERNLALGQKKRNGVWVEEKGIPKLSYTVLVEGLKLSSFGMLLKVSDTYFSMTIPT